MEPRHRRKDRSPYAPPPGRTRPAWVETAEHAGLAEETVSVGAGLDPEVTGRHITEAEDTGLSDTRPVSGETAAEPKKREMAEDVLRLVCTLAGMMSVFAAFLLWAEKDHVRIRHFCIRSVFLAVMNLFSGGILYAVGRLMGPIPFLGMVVDVFCLTAYLVLAIVLLIIRLKMMHCAWKGEFVHLPLAEAWIEKIWHV